MEAPSPLLVQPDPSDPRLADYRDLRDVELRKHFITSNAKDVRFLDI